MQNIDFKFTRIQQSLRFISHFKPWWKNWVKRFSQLTFLQKAGAIFLGLLAVPFLTFTLFLILLLAGVLGPIPSGQDLRNINQNLASEIYSADGVLLGRFYFENRLPVGLDEISPHAVHAAVATEDARFYKHSGIDYRALGRVFVKTILMQQDESGGGSTITQQLAKNLYPRRKYLLFSVPVNKLKEIVIAKRLENIYSKDELLVMYLNTIPFSGNVFGIKAAALRFFDKTPAELKPEEAAVLIGMLKATTAYHPLMNPERSTTRRNTVLSLMEKQGFLSQQESDSLQQLPLLLQYKVRTHNDGVATYFREHLRLQLEEELKKYTKPDGSAYNLYTDGLKIYTTLNSRLQQHAEKAVETEMRNIQESYFKHFKKIKNGVPYGSEGLLQQQIQLSERCRLLKQQGLSKAEIDSSFALPVEMTIYDWKTGGDKDTLMSPLDSVKYYLSLLNTGFLAVDAKTGRILAWVGGTNFKHLKFDHVKSRRQVGSTFKPVLYCQALESGISPCKHFRNEFVVYEEFDGWSPRNVNEKYGGYYNMEGALKKSINTIAVKVILEVGVGPVKEMAKKMGVTSPIPHEAGIALGGVDISLFEMVNVFATIANQGARPELHSLLRIETADGQTIAEIQPPDPKKFQRALSQSHADMMTYMLTKVVDGRGTAASLRDKYDVKGPIAAKTGTSNDNRDGWFVGFTPKMVFGAWVGGEHQQVRFRETRLGQGSSTAMPICADFLNRVYEDQQFASWEKDKFPPLDSLTKDILDCYKTVEIDTLLTDSIDASEGVPEEGLIELKGTIEKGTDNGL